MINQNNAPLDFDPTANYLAEVQAEQGESSADSVEGSVDIDLGQLEAETLQSVAAAKEGDGPSPADTAVIAEIETGLGVKHDIANIKVGDHVSLDQLWVVGNDIGNYPPEQEQAVTSATREYQRVRNIYGDDHPKTVEKIAQLNNVSRPNSAINGEAVVATTPDEGVGEEILTNEAELSQPRERVIPGITETELNNLEGREKGLVEFWEKHFELDKVLEQLKELVRSGNISPEIESSLDKIVGYYFGAAVDSFDSIPTYRKVAIRKTFLAQRRRTD